MATRQEQILIHLYGLRKYGNAYEMPYATTQDGIAEAIGISRGQVSIEIKKLEEKGYVVRTRSDADERVLTVTVTEEGMGLRERALSVPGAVASCIPVSPEDAAELARILRGMMASFSETGEQ